MKSFVRARGRHSKSRGKKRGEYIILLLRTPSLPPNYLYAVKITLLQVFFFQFCENTLLCNSCSGMLLNQLQNLERSYEK